MYNQNQAEIPENRFEQIVNMYWRDASFCVNLVIEADSAQSLNISPKVSFIIYTDSEKQNLSDILSLKT